MQVRRWTGRRIRAGLDRSDLSRLRSGAQTLGQFLKVVRALLPARFDGRQHLSSGVKRVQDEGYQGRTKFPSTVAQLAQEGLRLMGDRFQGRKCEETAGPLDGVNSAEDACQQIGILRALLKFDKLLIQTREVLMAFNEEFPNYVLILHAPFLLRNRRRGLHHSPQHVLHCERLLITISWFALLIDAADQTL